MITFESANFKLDPELNPLNDHLLIPCRASQQFFILFHFPQRSDKSEENEDSRVNRKRRVKNGREKEGRENGNVNHHKTEQPSKKTKGEFILKTVTIVTKLSVTFLVTLTLTFWEDAASLSPLFKAAVSFTINIPTVFGTTLA